MVKVIGKQVTKILFLSFVAVAIFAGAMSGLKAGAVSVKVATMSGSKTVSGDYLSFKTSAAVKRINEIRKEACTQGVVNPANGKKLKASDYIPVVWSTTMTAAAKTRAAEMAVMRDHARPNGQQTIVGKKQGGAVIYGENLAWHDDRAAAQAGGTYGVLYGIEQWYDEKAMYLDGIKDSRTGHYQAMIIPQFNTVGMAAFVENGSNTALVAQEMGASLQGEKIKSGAATYKVVKPGQTVALYKYSGSAKSVTVPDTVALNGVTYKVTEIGVKAFYGNTKMKTVKIGKNVAKVGAGAFTGTSKALNVRLSKAKFSALKKIILKSGVSKTAKFTKY